MGIDAIKIDDLTVEYSVKNKGLLKGKNKEQANQSNRWLSLKIKKEEKVVALLGKNGAGKTTLLRAIGGSLRPNQGRVETIGRVFTLRGSNPGIIPHLSARENVNLLAKVYGVSSEKLEQFEREVEKFCELGEAYDRSCSSFQRNGRKGVWFHYQS